MKMTIIYFATKDKTHRVFKDGLWSVDAAKRWTDQQGWSGRGKVEHWAGDKPVACYQY